MVLHLPYQNYNSMKSKKVSTHGFTLIEILVVATIIGLLASIAATSYSSLTRSSRDARRKTDLEQMRASLEMYRNTNGAYPSTGGTGNWHGACSGYGSYPDTGAGGYIPGLAPTYMQALPHDPRESIANTLFNAGCAASQTCYLYTSDGANYKLLAHCTNENAIASTDSYKDPHRPSYSYAVWSSNATVTW